MSTFEQDAARVELEKAKLTYRYLGGKLNRMLIARDNVLNSFDDEQVEDASYAVEIAAANVSLAELKLEQMSPTEEPRK